jgi:hypothetical protein
MDRWMAGRLVGVIPKLAAVGVVAPSLLVVLVVIPSPEPVVMSVAPAVVVRILRTVIAPIPQG